MRWGIIGAGMMGQEHIRNLALLPDAQVLAIVEPDAAMAAAAMALAPDARCCDSVTALLDQPVDAVLIASPNDLHLSQIEQIAATRPLPLMVEKPLFTDPGSTDRLAALATYPAPVWVAMEYRYMPPIARLVSTADSVTGGVRMLSIREHRFPFLHKVGGWNRFNARSGGTMVEKCCHFFDLMRLILQDDPVRVMASAGQAVNHKDERVDGRQPDVWDSGYVIVDFARGGRAMLELCMFAEGARYQEQVAATGPDGLIEAFVPGPTRFWPDHLGAPPVAQVIASPRTPKGPHVLKIPVDPTLLAAGDHNGSTFWQHQRFARAMAGDGPVEVPVRDGWWAVAMGMAAQDSARTGRAIEIADQPYAPPARSVQSGTKRSATPLMQ
ncbi:Gfo/Idh/MocA family oxidoreductase [Paracoccus sp. TK19116]|uniref:Gfo/Idh/MocA family oxidoreductase n=1 Tax=Paracoccus albicereus TaxID=2922394 RepID=A0ABT1MP56_9RHOB|nr:Gfo/Idh/MocA family oxidoreductase [Paracoccus albicereus]MCQ0970073.1 Gfo/Idh/MocA family oxidoreductase [Paracoccus albicereus]